ncbi:hypothetical protein BV898_14570 [Hypsibius exemplaris]|uniref:CB1 cannabinoid receptor-interacting protein 1 n=1 Tax=Hypsibius exemplaris TaxID=2072580 RepID=A0A9X6NAE6_HYPEX|nr:hypothetical protein BV898_14570 [Hypsibius exemplaris]
MDAWVNFASASPDKSVRRLRGGSLAGTASSTLGPHDGNKIRAGSLFSSSSVAVVMHEQNGGKFRLTIHFRRESNDRPVVFKSDGERFLQPVTVKFNQDETYTVQISVDTPLSIESLVLHEEKISLEEIENKDTGTIVYHGKWKPQAFERTRPNHREQLKILIGFKHHGTLLTTLQAKFYSHDEVTHSSWGETLNAVILESQFSSYNTVNILRQHVI